MTDPINPWHPIDTETDTPPEEEHSTAAWPAVWSVMLWLLIIWVVWRCVH
jgi:hypothetical protein